jgi:hypothetical protein
VFGFFLFLFIYPFSLPAYRTLAWQHGVTRRRVWRRTPTCILRVPGLGWELAANLRMDYVYFESTGTGTEKFGAISSSAGEIYSSNTAHSCKQARGVISSNTGFFIMMTTMPTKRHGGQQAGHPRLGPSSPPKSAHHIVYHGKIKICKVRFTSITHEVLFGVIQIWILQRN